MSEQKKIKRGFAILSPEKHKAASSKGGKSYQAKIRALREKAKQNEQAETS